MTFSPKKVEFGKEKKKIFLKSIILKSCFLLAKLSPKDSFKHYFFVKKWLHYLVHMYIPFPLCLRCIRFLFTIDVFYNDKCESKIS
jgi:hypothetical protein